VWRARTTPGQDAGIGVRYMRYRTRLADQADAYILVA
jgi:hypothetical protein